MLLKNLNCEHVKTLFCLTTDEKFVFFVDGGGKFALTFAKKKEKHFSHRSSCDGTTLGFWVERKRLKSLLCNAERTCGARNVTGNENPWAYRSKKRLQVSFQLSSMEFFFLLSRIVFTIQRTFSGNISIKANKKFMRGKLQSYLK